MRRLDGASRAVRPSTEAVLTPLLGITGEPSAGRAAESASAAARATAPTAGAPATAAASATPLRRRSRPRALLALARPRQWLKNVLVIAAPGAAGVLLRSGVGVRVIVACLAFCLLSAGIYALNDVRDRDEDRQHPRKRFRPVASGEISPRLGVAFGVVCIVAGLVICVVIAPLLALIGLAYIALTVSYSWVWRSIAWVDLVALAAGFVLRASAGGAAAPVHLSRWFVLVITFCALFVAVGKRLSELLSAAAAGRRPRRVVRRYTEIALQRALIAAGTLALFAYCMWAFEVPTVDGVPWRLLTIVPFAECLRRYGRLIRAGEAEAPEDAIVSSRAMILWGLAWALLFALSVNAA